MDNEAESNENKGKDILFKNIIDRSFFLVIFKKVNFHLKRAVIKNL
jgi:hypothetical protein